MTEEARLRHFPVSWFAVVMGMSGFSIAWIRAGDWLGAPEVIGTGLLVVTVSVFIITTLLYAAKLLRHGSAVTTEFNHPVKINFFPTFSIALVLLSIAFLHPAPGVSKVLWTVGVVLHLLFTLYVMSVWLSHAKFQIHNMNPAWFIPVVGNILVPIAGVHHYSPEISWFYFSIGLVFWIVLLTIVYYRVIFHDPLPDRLVPTLFILIAPPAVGSISWIALVGEVGVFARILYYTGLFLALLLMMQLRRFTRLQFFLSWWAYSFPLAAITIATLVMARHLELPFLTGLSWFFIGLLTLVMVMLVVKTAFAVSRGEICVEE